MAMANAGLGNSRRTQHIEASGSEGRGGGNQTAAERVADLLSADEHGIDNAFAAKEAAAKAARTSWRPENWDPDARRRKMEACFQERQERAGESVAAGQSGTGGAGNCACPLRWRRPQHTEFIFSPPTAACMPRLARLPRSHHPPSHHHKFISFAITLELTNIRQ